MTIDQILNSNATGLAAALKTAHKGTYINERYCDRNVSLEKTDAGYVVEMTNPNNRRILNNAVDTIAFIKKQLGV